MRMNRCNSGTDSKGSLAGFSSLDGRRTVLTVCAGILCGRTVRYVMKALRISLQGFIYVCSTSGVSSEAGENYGRTDLYAACH